MTWFSASISCKIHGTSWDIHHQMSFPLKNVPCEIYIHLLAAVIDHYLTLRTNKQHPTGSLHITDRWESPATNSHTQQDSSWVECAGWLLLIPFWLEANYIFLRTSHFLSLSTSSPIPHQHIMSTETPLQGYSGWEWSQLTGNASYTSVAGTQQQCQYELVHHNVGNAATENMTQNAHWDIVCKTGSSMN